MKGSLSVEELHIIILLNEDCLYIVAPLVASVLENNREDTTEDTTEVTTEDTREVVLIVTDEAVEEVMDSV